MSRNYRKEYDNYHSKPEQRANRSSRNKARRKLVNAGRNVAGKDVDHKNGNPRDNRLSNLSITSKSTNRSKK
jgi:hypothetical protein